MSLSTLNTLEKKCALQSAQLAYLSEICQSLNSETEINRALRKLVLVLPREMSSSKMAVYVKDSNESLSLFTHIGFDANELPMLEQFYTHLSILYEVINQKKVLNLPSHEVSYELNELIGKQSNIRSGLLVPLLSSSECMGVLFVGTSQTNYIDPEIDHFIQTVGIQIGQAIALNIVYNKVKFSEMRYRTLMDSASCSIFVADLQGTILETNQQGEKLLECSKSEIIGKRFRDFFKPELVAKLAEWTKDLVINKYLEHTEIQIQRKNGEIRTVDGSGVLVKIGKDDLVFMIGTDVTEFNNLRAQTLLSDKLATIGLLAAGVAHEINNPIACVLSNLEFMDEKVIELIEEDGKNKSDIIQTLRKVLNESRYAAVRVKEIVNDLNAYSRNDDGSIKKINIEEILDSAINMALSECKNRAVIEKHYAAGIPPLYVNGGKLHQVFLNIIINAAQSIPEGDPEHNIIRISTDTDSDKVIIAIEDTGRGISPETVSKIFDPFFTTKPVGQGTGLGLFICHEIIKNMKGIVKVDSKLDQGSKFIIELPVPDERSSTQLSLNQR